MEHWNKPGVARMTRDRQKNTKKGAGRKTLFHGID
jgi:hypothetical protein